MGNGAKCRKTGQSRRFDRVPVISGPPGTTDWSDGLGMSQMRHFRTCALGIVASASNRWQQKGSWLRRTYAIKEFFNLFL